MTLKINKEVKKYYIFNFIRGLFSIKSGNFVMGYFFFHGFTLENIIICIMIYAFTSLILSNFVHFLSRKIGVKKTFILHLIPTIITFFIIINISIEKSWLFYLWMFVHAFSVMFMRIPLNAYFAKYGHNKMRGRQLGFLKIIELLSNVVGPVLFGLLIDTNGLFIFISIRTIGYVIASFVIGYKNDFKSKNNISLKQSLLVLPIEYRKVFFFSNIIYYFTNDILFIWILLKSGNFSFAGIIISIKIALEILLNYLVGHLSDKNKIWRLFNIAIWGNCLFWIFIPFVQNLNNLMLLQITLGIFLIIIDIPFNKRFYDLAKNNKSEVLYSSAREVYIHLGILIGGPLALILLYFIKSWNLLLILGVFSVLPYLLISSNLKSIKENH